MERSNVMTGLAFLLVLVIGAWFVLASKSQRETDVTLSFHARMGDDPLVYDEFIYENPGGSGVFRVRDFRFFASNLTLVQGEKTYAEPDSYHLLRFDNPETTHTIELLKVPLRSVEEVRFLIGVDPVANSSIEARGELDPNSQMAWNWEVGYKFVVFEGALRVGEAVSPLVYHVGFSENAREVSIALPPVLSSETTIHLNVDLSKLFDGASQIDMQVLPSVKFNRTDASLLAENYADMIAPESLNAE